MQNIRLKLVLIATLLIACHSFSMAQTNCKCWITRDSSWHVVPFALDSDEALDTVPLPPLYRNDDASTTAIHLPFNFCFWGTTMDSLFINNNGTVSFGQAYSSFVPTGFPSTNYSMVAPFWGDVDTRYNTTSSSQSGVVYYKMTTDYLAVQWDSVGYYDLHDDKLNSFQVVISNGADPIIPTGNNVEFCYRTMQWTTGDASGGTNGFGGAPATVGANKGDGTSYVQFGLFDSSGNSYLGQYPPAPYDGISWLDNKSFFFNTCSNTVPPIVTGISSCDTLQICTGDTVDIEISYLSPNSADTTRSVLLPPFVPGVSILSNKAGNTDSIVLQIIGATAGLGFHTIRLCGFDNQHPPDTTYSSIVLEVDSSPIGHIISSKDTICKGDSVILSATSNVNNYQWSTTQTTDSIKVKPTSTTSYTLSIGKGKCSLSLVKNIVVLSATALSANKDTICAGDTAILRASGGTSYKWNTGATTSTIIVQPLKDSTYWVIAANQCFKDTLKVPVTVFTKPKVIVSGNTSVCKGQSTVLTSGGGTNYLWSNGSTATTITVTDTVTTTYTVTSTNGKCSSDTTVTVKVTNPPVVTITPNQQICQGASVTLTATGGGTYVWSNTGSSTTASITVTPSVNTTYTVTVSNGCTATGSTTVTVSVPSLTACCDTTIAYGSSVTLKTTGTGISYTWAPASGLSCTTCADPVATPTVTTTYTVTSTDAAGCTLSATVTVEVNCKDFDVPNVFTPNGDNVNDFFLINAPGLQAYHIEIFDRWGVKVYSSNDLLQPWDGRNLSGTMVPDGVYYYIITSTCGNKDYDKHGFVQVIK